MGHVFEDGYAGCCSWYVIEGDGSSFNLMHAVPIGDSNINAIGHRPSVADASLFPCIMITCRGVQFPRGLEVTGVVVVGEATVGVWSGNRL